MHKFRRTLFSLMVLQIPLWLGAQKSNLYLFDLLEIAGKYELHQPRLLSEFNPDGYNNQPYFIDNYTLILTAAPKEDLANSDIFQLDLRSHEMTRITKTPDREYSPTLSMQDPKLFNCVVVDVENGDKQILWQYPLDRSNGGKAWLKDWENVGYFQEMNDNWVAIFEVGTPNKLYLTNSKTGEKKFISNNIGRALRMTKDGQLIYVHKFSDDYWFLKRLRPETLLSEIVKKTLPGSEDFTLLDDDSILMGQGSKLYRLDQFGENQWKEVANLEKYGITNIKRLAFNGINEMVIVDQK
ncbi:MAG: hypothetical protein KDC53_20300 [Saprospiraceae bacterium]|nr:hypothetical protein [Saprospiraceae bacterium]